VIEKSSSKPKLASDLKAIVLALRKIGWAEWDPIGLGPPLKSFADEYDTYLLAAAGKLVLGRPFDRVVKYLVHVETKTMGMTMREDRVERAEKTVRRIAEFFALSEPLQDRSA
jgi:hypothetical protein